MCNAPEESSVQGGIRKHNGDEGHRGGSGENHDDDCLGFLCGDSGNGDVNRQDRWGNCRKFADQLQAGFTQVS